MKTMKMKEYMKTTTEHTHDDNMRKTNTKMMMKKKKRKTNDTTAKTTVMKTEMMETTRNKSNTKNTINKKRYFFMFLPNCKPAVLSISIAGLLNSLCLITLDVRYPKKDIMFTTSHKVLIIGKV